MQIENCKFKIERLPRRWEAAAITMRPRLAILTVLIALYVPAFSLRADDAGLEFFEKKVRPLLVTHCYECHSADARKIGGGLLLDSRDDVLKGGESGPVIEPGQLDA